MALYVAKHHIGLDTYTARPGEVFEADFDAETVNRLVKANAIDVVDMTMLEPELAGELGLRINDEEAAEFEALNAEANKDEEIPAEEPAAEAEPDEEAAPPEIDVADAVSVSKPAKKGGRRK